MKASRKDKVAPLKERLRRATIRLARERGKAAANLTGLRDALADIRREERDLRDQLVRARDENARLAYAVSTLQDTVAAKETDLQRHREVSATLRAGLQEEVEAARAEARAAHENVHAAQRELISLLHSAKKDNASGRRGRLSDGRRKP